ncbi:MAG TPA: ABC transporter ATP-binding protein [SAR202 cluster bacterium]|jgi:ABC-type lipoprotein export system ATPase subunit|nr:ABC transporter ATP-binding protein [SAR202 cluster bacterium]|tara:strand:+ start:1681 stop:2577 length:897 start_codon:yes stop_codon:yes gene_type:complete
MKTQIEHVVCTDVFKIFKVADLEVVALRGLDLTVYESEVVALVGASGSGKSTLLNILAGYDSPSAGQVTIAGKDLINMKGSEIEKFHREEIGFVWQQASRNLFPYLTSLENVALPMLLSTTSDSERKNRSEHLLNMVGMEHRSDHIPDQLSGGEQQRVAIAVGLANDPSLILADEPTGELDDRTASEILDLFGKVNQESKTTIVIVTHDPDIAYKVGRVVVIKDGKTSSEIHRRDLDSKISGEMDKTKPLEESLLIDSNGRVQIPRELLQTTGITNKVKAVAENTSIRIQPPEESPTE